MLIELEGLNEGLANIGFDIYEAIMESIEDSIDANAKKIHIDIFNEEISVNICKKFIKSDRISYLIKDYGSGIENLREVFNFGKHKEDRFTTIEELKLKNGIYHYGAISHLNVGIYVTLYSKIKNGEWKEINVYYDQYNKKAFIDDEKTLDQDSIHKMKILCRYQIPSESGSIIYVRGVSKDNIIEAKEDITEIEENIDNVLNEEDDIEYIIKLLMTKIGIKYKRILENKINPIEILVNNKRVKAKDIFLQGEELPENLRTGKPFASYQISLKQIIDNLKDDIKFEILFHRYENIFESREKFLTEHITMDFYALSNEYKLKRIQNKYKIGGYLIPSTYYSGLFIRRNNIYIGNTAKIMDIFNLHPDFNTFRGEISFSPIFDEFFEIQINKNKYRISNVLETLIEKVINEDDKLIGRSAKAKIKNALKGKFNTKKIDGEQEVELQFTLETIDNLKKLRTNLKECKDLMSNNFINENIQIKLKGELDRLSREDIKHKDEAEVKEVIKNVNKQINKYKRIYIKVSNDFMSDFIAFENRVNNILNQRKKLNLEDKYNENYSFIEGIREPKNEAEMYGILVILLKINPSLFEFDILDYDYQNSLDNVIEVNQDVFQELKMEDRFNGKIEDISDINDILSDNLDITDIIENKKYCFMEMKMELPKKMNHSMRFVSHIMCWDRNNVETMLTDYVSYDVDNENDILLVNNEPRVKIIYLKELLEKEVGCIFK